MQPIVGCKLERTGGIAVSKESEQDIYITPNDPSPSRPVIIDADTCIACNECVEVCPRDIFMPNPEDGKPPRVVFQEECWYDGSCVFICPVEGAIKLHFPLMWRVPWKRKKTGEHVWVNKIS
jgi:NAD-dependent dihydropyrimidine dehydrogenase PreA subunit